MKKTLRSLTRSIGYEFVDEGLLEQALTHRSAGAGNYERLEFLGDGLLNFLVAEALFELRPEAAEGELTRLRASLVKASTLAALSAEHGLGACLTLGPGELGSGGHRRVSILSDALESLLGAIYLDGGFEPVRRVIRRLFHARLAGLPDAEALKDAKTRLQEILQARGIDLPTYELVASEGKDHARVFTTLCRVPAIALEASATGSSRRKAEQAAAARVLEMMEHG